MSGKRERNFRQGDIAEGMGLELLRRISLVAPVPRSEDVGVDAVCTLLRPDDRYLYAENTFAVQVKAASKRRLDLDNGTWRWMREFDLPFYWLSVDLQRATAALYSFVNAFAPGTFAIGHGTPNCQVGDSTRLVLDRPAGSLSPELQPWFLLRRPQDPAEVPFSIWIGPPVMELRFDEADTKGFASRVYPTLKSHSEAFSAVLRARRIGVHRGLSWETGGPPTHLHSTAHGDGPDLKSAFEALGDPLARAEALLGHGWDESAELRAEFAAIKRKALALGLDGPWMPVTPADP